MRALITGGAGFIGSNLTRSLINAGNDVTIIDNLSSGYRKNLEWLHGDNFIYGDIRDTELLDRITRNVDIIYHLAASVGNKRSIDNPTLDAEINVTGTLNILQAARKHGVKKIVVSSSAGIFGELREIPVTESHPINPCTPYACSKLYAEKIALSYAALYGIEAVCLRYFNVYGPNQRFDAYGNVIPIFVFNLLRDLPLTIFGDGEQTRDFVNVEDVVQANIAAGEMRGLSGAFNIASGTRITINQLAREIALVAGKKPDVIHAGKRPGDVRDSLADINAAKCALSYLPRTTLQDGLIKYIKWARAELISEHVMTT